MLAIKTGLRVLNNNCKTAMIWNDNATYLKTCGKRPLTFILMILLCLNKSKPAPILLSSLSESKLSSSHLNMQCKHENNNMQTCREAWNCKYVNISLKLTEIYNMTYTYTIHTFYLPIRSI